MHRTASTETSCRGTTAGKGTAPREGNQRGQCEKEPGRPQALTQAPGRCWKKKVFLNSPSPTNPAQALASRLHCRLPPPTGASSTAAGAEPRSPARGREGRMSCSAPAGACRGALRDPKNDLRGLDERSLQRSAPHLRQRPSKGSSILPQGSSLVSD